MVALPRRQLAARAAPIAGIDPKNTIPNHGLETVSLMAWNVRT